MMTTAVRTRKTQKQEGVRGHEGKEKIRKKDKR